MEDNIGHNGGPPLSTDDNPYGRDGYIRVARAMREHPIVGFGKTVKPAEHERGFCYSRAEAWQDLIMECRWAPGEIINKGRKMEIKPGQLLGAISWLAHRWNWTPKTVRWFLDQLQADHMIHRSEPGSDGLLTQIDPSPDSFQARPNRGNQKGNRNGNQIGVLTVCNYEIYQIALHAQRQAKGHDERQAHGKPTASARQANGNTLIKEEGNNNKIITQLPQSLDAARRASEVGEVPAAEPNKPWTGDSVELAKRLMSVCNGALADPVNCSGLLSAATPIAWLRRGCDLELDVMETLRALGTKHHGKKIRSWDYFTAAIEDARDRRIKGGMRPPPLPPRPPGTTPDGISIEDLRRRDAEDAAIVQRQWQRGVSG